MIFINDIAYIYEAIPSIYFYHDYSALPDKEKKAAVKYDTLKLGVYAFLHDPDYLTFTKRINFAFNTLFDFLCIKGRGKNSKAVKDVSAIFDTFIKDGVIEDPGYIFKDQPKNMFHTFKHGDNFFRPKQGYGKLGFACIDVCDLRKIINYSEMQGLDNKVYVDALKILCVFLNIKALMRDTRDGEDPRRCPSYCIKRYSDISQETGYAEITVRRIINILTDEINVIRKGKVFIVDDKGDMKGRGNIYVLNNEYWEENMKYGRAKYLNYDPNKLKGSEVNNG